MRQLTSTRRRSSSQLGLTLIELMVTITIAAILAVAGLPAYADYVANARLREGANLIVTGSNFARSEAIKRNKPVHVVMVGQRLSLTIDSDATEIRSIELPATLQASSLDVTFDSTGRLAPFGTPTQVISLSSSDRACGGDMRCPAVRVQPGGSVGLCRTGDCS